MDIKDLLTIKTNQRHPLYWKYHHLRHFGPIWNILNAKARLDFMTHKPSLTDTDKKIIHDLKKDGISISHYDRHFTSGFNALVSHAEMLFNAPAVQNEIRMKREGIFNAETGNKKEFFVYALGGHLGSGSRLDTGDPLIAFVLDRKIKNIVDSYFGLRTQFHNFGLLQTLVAKDERMLWSQKWHRDPDDRKIVKVFIYLNDVDDDTGPFMYVKGSQLGGKWRNFYPQIPPTGVYPPEGAVESAVPREDIAICTGKAGTIIFADTSGLHKGGFCKKKDRKHFVGGFTSWATIIPKSY